MRRTRALRTTRCGCQRRPHAAQRGGNVRSDRGIASTQRVRLKGCEGGARAAAANRSPAKRCALQRAKTRLQQRSVSRQPRSEERAAAKSRAHAARATCVGGSAGGALAIAIFSLVALAAASAMTARGRAGSGAAETISEDRRVVDRGTRSSCFAEEGVNRAEQGLLITAGKAVELLEASEEAAVRGGRGSLRLAETENLVG